MRILHTESSTGWGGQEIRILREMVGMKERGHELFLIVAKGGALAPRARALGFPVVEIPLSRGSAPLSALLLLFWMVRWRIQLVNTHSSWDSWCAGVVAKLLRKKVVRTRHLSTAIRPGYNSVLLYRLLADFVVTTSASIIPMIAKQSGRSITSVRSIPTGVMPGELCYKEEEVQNFRSSLGLKPGDFLVGTACFVRSWKGILDLMKAARLLRHEPGIRWVVIGGGHVDQYRHYVTEMGISDLFCFTGHLEKPYHAIAALDLFALLSTNHEGVSQASLQAAYLARALVTTPVGGLPEVCLEGITGYIVPPHSPQDVAQAVLRLKQAPHLREKMGRAAHSLVMEKFLFEKTLNDMELVYNSL